MCFRVRALAPTHRHGRAHLLPAPLPPSSALLPQALCYGADTLLFVTLHATDIDAHLSAAVIGALIIIAPTLMQHIAGRHVQGRRNAGRGMQVALLLGFLWLVMVVTLHSLKFPIGPALQLCSGYTIACLVVACLAIYRFLCTLLLVYAIYLGTAIGSLLLIYADYFQVGPVLTICGLTLAGFGLPPVLVSPLAKQYADLREERALSLLARSVQEREARDVEAKAVRPTRSKAKHALKAGRLASRGELLPQLSDLSHNGVLERAGAARWCQCASDGRPMLPFTSQLLVARGSFLYLFTSGGELLPSTRALDAIPVYHARVSPISECAGRHAVHARTCASAARRAASIPCVRTAHHPHTCKARAYNPPPPPPLPRPFPAPSPFHHRRCVRHLATPA